jgi:hypothetical protein
MEQDDCLLGCCALIALMMEAVSNSETSVNFYETTQRSYLHTSSRVNLRSQFIWELISLLYIFLFVVYLTTLSQYL